MMPDVVEWTAYHLIKWKKGSEPDESDEEIYEGLSFLISNCSVIVLSLAIACFTGNLVECVFAITTFWTTRILTGGFHMKTLTGCVVLSVFIFTVISNVELPAVWFLYFLAPALIIIMVWRDKEQQHNWKQILVLCGLAATAFGLFIAPSTVALSVCAQALTLFGRGWRHE
jgi:accessory gene regulator B